MNSAGQPLFGTGAGGSPFYQANGEALMNEVNNPSLFDAKLSERSRQANGEALTTGGSNRVFIIKPFSVLFGAPKSTERKINNISKNTQNNIQQLKSKRYDRPSE
jgi:hypothetical protein